jgi:hypothetical protein
VPRKIIGLLSQHSPYFGASILRTRPLIVLDKVRRRENLVARTTRGLERGRSAYSDSVAFYEALQQIKSARVFSLRSVMRFSAGCLDEYWTCGFDC